MSAARSVLKTFFAPLATPKSPRLAVVIGVLTGGIGLSIYFGSLRDLFPVELSVWLVVIVSLIAGANPLQFDANPLGLALMVVPVVVGGLYGFWRAQNSNRRLDASRVAAFAAGSAG